MEGPTKGASRRLGASFFMFSSARGMGIVRANLADAGLQCLPKADHRNPGHIGNDLKLDELEGRHRSRLCNWLTNLEGSAFSLADGSTSALAVS